MTAIKTNLFDKVLTTSENGRLIADFGFQMNGPTLRTVSTAQFTAVGAGTLTITPIFVIEGTEHISHLSYAITNDSAHLDLTSADDWEIAESSTTDSVSIRISTRREQ